MNTETKHYWLAMLLGFAVMFVVSPATLAAGLPLDNRLTPIINDDAVTIDFTGININYLAGSKWTRGKGAFLGFSDTSSTFTLSGPGYEGVSFNGFLAAGARIDAQGDLTSGFVSIHSNDEIFGFGTKEKCFRNHCVTKPVTGLVFGADLTDFGWSGSEGIIEFVESNLSGWAADLWKHPNGGDERLLFFTDPFDINKSFFGATADGIAIVPIPAAVWLFGSGLLGLAGIARRKKA